MRSCNIKVIKVTKMKTSMANLTRMKWLIRQISSKVKTVGLIIEKSRPYLETFPNIRRLYYCCLKRII